MLQTCVFRFTSPPGPCDKVVLGYHSPLENGNPSPGRMLKKSASGVLASFRPSTGTRPPHQLGGAHRLGAPYSSHRAPQRVRLGPSLAAALLDELFEHPAKVFSCCDMRVDHRSSGVLKHFPTPC